MGITIYDIFTVDLVLYQQGYSESTGIAKFCEIPSKILNNIIHVLSGSLKSKPFSVW